MENQILSVSAGLGKSILLRDDELWVGGDQMISIEKFEQAINKAGGMLQSGAYKIALSEINEISYNESYKLIDC